MPTEGANREGAVRHDLAARLGIPEDQVAVVEVEAVDWADTSLGCPEPGRVYAQTITPGSVITLEATGQEYVYHTGVDRFVLCELPTEPGTPAADHKQSPEDKLDPEVAALVEEAKRDLSDRFNIGADHIALRSVEAMEWRNSSLGCPQPGMNYLMVITPGYLIRVEADGKLYEYHASRIRVIFCDKPEPPATELDPARRLADAAKADLSQRLNLPADQIAVIQVQPREWGDTSLGCPQVGMLYAQVITPGYQILLSAQGQQYDYRAGLATVLLCEK